MLTLTWIFLSSIFRIFLIKAHLSLHYSIRCSLAFDSIVTALFCGRPNGGPKLLCQGLQSHSGLPKTLSKFENNDVNWGEKKRVLRKILFCFDQTVARYTDEYVLGFFGYKSSFGVIYGGFWSSTKADFGWKSRPVQKLFARWSQFHIVFISPMSKGQRSKGFFLWHGLTRWRYYYTSWM